MGAYLDIAQALADTIADGTMNSEAIDAAVMDGDTSRLTTPCVRVVPPAVGYDPLAEGFRVETTEWTLHLYTGRGSEISIEDDLDLLEAVEDAIDADTTIGGTCSRAYPTMSPEPTPTTIAGQRGAQRRMLIREMTIRMDH